MSNESRWANEDDIHDKLRRALADVHTDITTVCYDAQQHEKQLRHELDQQRSLKDAKQKEINQLNASYVRLQTKCWHLESQVRSQRELIEAMDAGMGGAWCRFWAGLFTKGGDHE